MIFQRLPEQSKKLSDWVKRVHNLTPKDSFAPVPMLEYSKFMRQIYDRLYSDEDISVFEEQALIKNEIAKLDAMANDTFFAVTYLDSHYGPKNKKHEIIVQHPGLDFVDFRHIYHVPKTPHNKHLSINTMPTSYKQIKKVKHIRVFNKSDSVFADWV